MSENTPAKKGFGTRIAEARKDAGYSQKALMDALGWPNESNARLSGYENESREPSLDDFQAIADACGVDPAWLVFDRPPKRRKREQVA
jgi:transcriptional regulator with XRE-family HTH domain